VSSTPEDGAIPVSVGADVAAALTVNGKLFELAPPGFTTLTADVPAVPGNVTVACSVLESTKLVETTDPPKTMLAPETKFEPNTVRAIEVLAVPLEGETPLTDGTGVVTVMVTLAELPPPGPALTTWTVCDPAEVDPGRVKPSAESFTKVVATGAASRRT
jgi:hypothetical protein